MILQIQESIDYANKIADLGIIGVLALVCLLLIIAIRFIIKKWEKEAERLRSIIDSKDSHISNLQDKILEISINYQKSTIEAQKQSTIERQNIEEMITTLEKTVDNRLIDNRDRLEDMQRLINNKYLN